jgi:hypothetical protein
MSGNTFEYTGTSNLEVMQEAVRYNSFLASLILNRTTGQTPQRMLDIGAGIGVFAERMRAAGFLASLLYKLIDKSGGINRNSLIFYDRFCFPLSRIGDMFFGKLFGKNVYVIAAKACVTQTINKAP